MPNARYHQLPKDKKDLIDQAVLDEMTRHIYEHLNLSNIVRDAEISRGSLYQYFTNKHDLYFYYIESMSQTKKTFFDQTILNDHTLPFTKKLEHLFKASMTFNEMYPKLAQIGLRIYESKDPDILNLIKISREQSQTLYVHLLKQDVSLKDLKDTHQIGSFIGDIFLSMTQSWMKHQSNDTFHTHMFLFLKILQGGLQHV